jgi:hypothetical protein
VLELLHTGNHPKLCSHISTITAAAMANARKRMLDACSSGDVSLLETLFQELNVGPNHPQSPYDLDRSIPEEEQLPDVMQMIVTAISSQCVETLSFLFERFPGLSCYGPPMKAAIDAQDPVVLDTVCKFDHTAADAEIGDDSTVNALGYACCKENGAVLVRVLLEAGADPNRIPPFRLPGCWNVSAAVLGGLPVETFEQFFQAVYRGNDAYAMKLAVEKNRLDVLSVLFARSKTFPGANFQPKEDLINILGRNKDSDMLLMIENAYAAHHHKGKGAVRSFIAKLLSYKETRRKRAKPYA